MGLFGKTFHQLRSSPLGVQLRRRVKDSRLFAPGVKLFLQRSIDYEYPLSFNVESTSRCNLSCKMCPRDRENKKDGFISFDLFRKIIDETRAYGPRSIALHKDGEPLLHREIVDMVEYIKGVNPQHNVYLTTNGLLLTEEHMRGFIQHRLDTLHFSVGASTPATYREVRGGDLEQVEARVEMAIDCKKAVGAKYPHISVQIIRMEETKAEVAEFVSKWKSKGVAVSVQELRNWAGTLEDVTSDELKKLLHPCHALWFAPSINWDGLVSVCCMDWDERGVIGDLNQQTLHEVWNGPELKRYREKHLAGLYSDIPICANCDHCLDYPDIWFSWQKR